MSKHMQFAWVGACPFHFSEHDGLPKSRLGFHLEVWESFLSIPSRNMQKGFRRNGYDRREFLFRSIETRLCGSAYPERRGDQTQLRYGTEMLMWSQGSLRL